MRSKRRRDAEDGELGKQESGGEERCGKLLGHEHESKEARKAGAAHCHQELPPVTAVAAGGEPTERDGLAELTGLWLSTGRTQSGLPVAVPQQGKGTTFCPQLQEAASKEHEQDTERGWHRGAGDALVPWW